MIGLVFTRRRASDGSAEAGPYGDRRIDAGLVEEARGATTTSAFWSRMNPDTGRTRSGSSRHGKLRKKARIMNGK